MTARGILEKLRNIEGVAWYFVLLAVLLIIGAIVGSDDELTPAEREACAEYVAGEYADAARGGYDPPSMPDCDR